MNKLDVIVNVYGKPWQTLCTLRSLMRHSGRHIDRIFFIEEAEQPFGDAVSQVAVCFTNTVRFRPRRYVKCAHELDLSVETDRHCVRYQYGLEKSARKLVFITHNDVLYTADIIGRMLEHIGDHAGIGLIGQCWNCPAFKAGLCDSERFAAYAPTYQEIMAVSAAHPPARAQHDLLVNAARPMPLPECRLNEFACIIDREIAARECLPRGDSPLFGLSDGIDVACGYFRSLILKGYTFKNYNIRRDCAHGFFAKTCGNAALLDREFYVNTEIAAGRYYLEHLV